MATPKILILGAGIAGLASGLALKKTNHITARIFEIRHEPSNIGGAVNLTPNAQRYLADLGVLDKLVPLSCEVARIELFALRTGARLSEISYDDVGKFRFRARRVMRSDLLAAMLATLEEAGVRVEYGKRAVRIANVEQGVEVEFEDGARATGDILLGCDGIHSFVRTAAVQPERKPVYSGISNAYGLLDASRLSGRLPFDATGMYSGRKGAFMMSYHDAAKEKLYASAVMETAAPSSREGWRLKVENRKEVKANILGRFGGSPQPLLDELIQATDDWYFYPVYKLAPKGKWHSGNCLLLGDAAHAMPPQGESVGLALEDVVLFSTLLAKYKSKTAAELFELFESLRTGRINAAFDEANFRWETVKDKGWLAGVMMEWITAAVLWWSKEERVKNFSFDVRDIPLPD